MSADKKVLLRIPTSLHEQVKARAKAAKISINSLIQRYIEQGALGVTALAGSGEIIKAADAQFGSNYIGLLLFGSRARGDAHDISDTDLLLVVEPSGRIADFSNSARSYITAGAVVRKTTHGQGFWVPI